MTKRRRSFEGSSKCSAPPSTVWSVWTDPAEWPGGVIDTANIDGDFAVGAKITIKVQGGLANTSTVTQLEPPRRWIAVSKFPGLTMTYEHLIESADGGTVVREHVMLTGPFAGVAAGLMGDRIAQTFAQTTARIACLAEARHAS
jgi:uncharacterized protein YndB with AHSA1/START domain